MRWKWTNCRPSLDNSLQLFVVSDFIRFDQIERVKIHWNIFETGNLMSISVGTLDGWSTINFVDLQNDNSTFTMGPLTANEAALINSISHIGALVGNFAVAPISTIIGIKHTIHLCALPIIVRTKNTHQFFNQKF